jgi:hypothetical protein
MNDLDLLRSHDELRAALLLAGKEIRKLNFGRKDSDVLKLLRRVLREAREVARAERSKRGLPSRDGIVRK